MEDNFSDHFVLHNKYSFAHFQWLSLSNLSSIWTSSSHPCVGVLKFRFQLLDSRQYSEYNYIVWVQIFLWEYYSNDGHAQRWKLVLLVVLIVDSKGGSHFFSSELSIALFC